MGIMSICRAAATILSTSIRNHQVKKRAMMARMVQRTRMTKTRSIGDVRGEVLCGLEISQGDSLGGRETQKGGLPLGRLNCVSRTKGGYR